MTYVLPLCSPLSKKQIGTADGVPTGEATTFSLTTKLTALQGRRHEFFPGGGGGFKGAQTHGVFNYPNPPAPKIYCTTKPHITLVK